ncbi:MAG: hypothetical protein IPJ51_02130 [Saprospiraceae bacterium]|nr:hypothetical protein [Saprospiraceae bacterium]
MLENAPEIMVNPIEICSGQNINLADFVTTDAGAVLTFHNATPPLPSNQLGSTIVNPISATTYYVLSTGPNCNAQATVEVIVSSSNTPFSTDITLCENSLAIPLNPYVNPPNLIGEWSGPGVSGSNFDPTGFTGNVVLNFNPENDCYLDGTLTIELNPQQIPDLSATEICSSSGPFDLVTLQDPGFPNGIWSGDGVTGNIFSPGALTGIIDVTFTPSGQCNSPATTTIEVFPIPNLNITQNNSVCAGETVNLNDYVINPSGHSITFYSALPASSANEILNPNINISDPSTFFIKATDIHGCFDIQPLTINIIPGINPVSGNIEVCENNGNIDLNQLLSPGNLTGIWIGSGVSGSNFNPIGLQGNFTITFDPDDVCFLMGSVNVEVTPLQTPTLQSTTLCAGSDPIDLSVLLDPDFPNGSWFGPGVNGNTFDPSLLNGTINLTFTPNEECSASGNTTIEIFNIPYVEITENIVVCAGESVDLNAYIVNTSGLEIHFYSSLPAIPVNELSNTVMTISNTTEFYITATDLNGCTATIPFTVNSAQGESPISDNISICELEANVDLSALLNPPGLPGIWSGPGVNGNNFSPFGLQGNVLLHFDPDNLCYADGNLNIDITPPEILSLGTAEICNGSNPYNLDVLLDPAFFDGTWSGFGVEGYYFNPSSLSGTVLLTFTPDEGCVGPGTTTITIQPEPFAEIINDITVCEGTEINLSDYVLNAFSHVISFHSSIPADLSNEISNTNIVVANTVQYYVKATNQYGCIFVQPMNIFAISGGTPDLGFDVVCKNEGIYNLNLLNDPVAGTGTWSGDGVLNNELQLNLLSGIVSVNFTPDNLCYEAATTYIEIRNPIPLNLGTANLCSTAGSFDLSTIRDPFFPDGSWSGLGVSNGFFNPDSLSGVVNLTFVPSAYCANNGLTVINVTKSQTPVLKQISICESIDTFHLINLADPLFTNGIWSGSGVVDSFFITNGLHGTNSIAFTPTQNCVFPASTTIEIIPYKTPVLQPLILCETSDPIDLLTLQDTLFVTGSWSGIGVQNNYFDPKGLSDKITATFISDVECTLSASTTITVNGSPKTADLKVVCDPTGRFYDVSFEMSGGDTSSYLVNGLSTGKQYISDTITSGLPYYFVVTDNNQCEPTILQGNKNCECTTGAGTMDFTNTPLKVCKSGVVYATHFGDQTLDPNDAFSFILHDQPGLQVGNILAVSQTPQFNFPSNGILDKTYYISAIAGDTLSNGSVKQNDGCFSMAAGVPVVFMNQKP